ncbi:MAG: NAD(P)-binding protein [Roseburia sp.]|nr:NAD(P)-binding protein [Roseburia sp.]MCM1096521.1 NAD(P)-binding protein [Ruminococcus flavefaciens]
MRYDYLVVGAGLFGAVFAHEVCKAGKTCLCIDRRTHLAGNIYTEEEKGIRVHKYGAHIFHTSDQAIWEYVNRFAEFNHFVNSPVAVYGEELYNLPFNMNTFSKMWGIRTPAEAQEIIERQRKEARALRTGAGSAGEVETVEPANLEEQALSLIGRDVYEKLVKGYTEKQWGRDCKDLPAFIIRRLPVRFTYDNNYFTDRYQGIPVGGYTQIVEKLLEGIPVKLGISFKEFAAEKADDTVKAQSGGDPKEDNAAGAQGGEGRKADYAVVSRDGDVFGKVLYTGMIDEYFDYCFGELQYRSLAFEEELLEGCENYQGNAVVNYTERQVPYTRIIEHKHFEFGSQPDTVITREYPAAWKKGDEPYYPINDERNSALYQRYAELAAGQERVLFGGRLGQYKYYDMDKVIAEALKMAAEELKGE